MKTKQLINTLLNTARNQVQYLQEQAESESLERERGVLQ